MAVISFYDDEDDWVVARWAFCGFLQHVRGLLKEEPDLQYVVEQAMALDGLHMSLSAPEIARRLAPILLDVADGVIAGKYPVSVEGRGVLDDESQALFRSAVKDLRERIVRYLSREPPPSKTPS